MILKRFISAILFCVMFFSFNLNVFAASVGETLNAPEQGWIRFDDKDPAINYSTGWYNNSGGSYYKSSTKMTTTSGETINFLFYGSKIRLIASGNTDRTENLKIKIDDVPENINLSRSPGYQYLVYEKQGLSYGLHKVEITTTDSKYAELDAIEIDTSGRLVTDNIVENIKLIPYISQISLAWEHMGKATSYTVKRSEVPGGPYKTIANLNDNKYVDKNLTNDKTYYYIIEANIGTDIIYTSTEVSETPNYPMISGMKGAVPPIGTTAEATSVYDNQIASRVLDKDLDTKWNAAGSPASITINFPYALEMNFIQLAAQTTPESQIDYTIYGLKNNEWIQISPVTTRTVNLDTKMKILEPIDVNKGFYEGIKIHVDAKNSWASLHEVTFGIIDSSPGTTEPEVPTEPEPQPNGDRAILVITMTTGLEKEYDLPLSDVNAFLNWYDLRDAGSGPAKFSINKYNNNKGPFNKRTDYVIFDKILHFEVNEYSL